MLFRTVQVATPRTEKEDNHHSPKQLGQGRAVEQLAVGWVFIRTDTGARLGFVQLGCPTGLSGRIDTEVSACGWLVRAGLQGFHATPHRNRLN